EEVNSDPPDPLEFDLVSARGSQFPSHFPLPSVVLKPPESGASSMELNFEASPTSRKSSLPGPTLLAQNAAMELDFSRTSSAPPERRSAPPPTNSTKSLAPSAPVPSTLGDNFNLGDDLDDLEFGTASAQLQVAVDTSDQERHVRWPTGRTPFTDEIAPDLARARELSGFGPAPRSVFLTPIYAVHVHRTLKTIHEQAQRAQRELSQREARRDDA